jgi:hypothetical protein
MTKYPGFWFDLLLRLKVTEVKVQNGTISWHVSWLFVLEHSNLVRSFIKAPSTFLPNLNPFKYGRQAVILENQLRAIDPVLCTYVLLGKSNSQTKFWSSLILDLVKTENTSAMTWTNDWISTKFLSWVPPKDTWHYTRVFDLTNFSRSQRSKSISRAHFVTTRAIDLKLCTYTYTLTIQSAVLCLLSYLHVISTTVNKSVKIYSQHKLCHESPHEHMDRGPFLCGKK